MNSLTGTGKLIRFILRRDRFTLPILVLFFGIMPSSLVAGIAELYPNQQARDQIAALADSNPAFTALLGPVFSPTLGGLVTWRGSLVALILGVISALMVIRHTRTDEEVGRRELLSSTVVGRHANLFAVTVVMVVANLLVAGIITVTMLGQDLDATGSMLLGAQYGICGILFAGVAAVAAQLTRGAGSARGIVFIVFGASLMLRMLGDLAAGMSWATWASPLGWVAQIQPFAQNNWWVLPLALGTTVVLVILGFVLSAHRDVEAGILATRLGRAEASKTLGSPLALAWRLQRGSLLGWSIGFALIGVMFGAMGESVEQMLNDTPALKEAFTQMSGGATLTETFMASMMGVIGLAAAGYGISAASKLRGEETELRAEQVLGTSVGKPQWMISHLTFAILGPAFILAVAGVSMGLTNALNVNDTGAVGETVVGALVQLPAVWVLTGLAVLLFGLVPRLLGLAWVALVVSLLFGQLGEALQLPEWMLNVSPFAHLPMVPGHEVAAQPLLWLSVVALAATVAGVTGFRRRDVG